MLNDALPEEWEILRGWLPADLDATAFACGFFRRRRGLRESERWLQLILMHVAGGLSLEQTALRARELGLAQISGVALFKRLRNAADWLRELCRHLLSEQQNRLGECRWPSEYEVRVIDATAIQEPGSTGTAWRIHYSIRLPELVCDHYELTDNKGGEKLGRFDFAPNQLILADRAYSHRAGAAQVLDAGAALLVRWNPSILPVMGRQGEAFSLVEKLRRLKERRAREWEVRFRWNNKDYDLRLCAIRKSRCAAERTRRQILDKARRNGTDQVQPQSLELAHYTLVLTSLPAKYSTTEVLGLYRCRWQIELAFKRLKSLLDTGHLPKSDDQSARAWMQAKILCALLLERLLLEANLFSPWGYQLPHSEPLAPLS
jgi:hypothetical protein